ncbi:MAG: hypothetical protein M3Q55_13370, partial [Acidobacteriota bacterium]|nr:hypothetical protein [Acidobacteriota bacterium]
MRIALRAPNWLGDAVMALPAMAALRRAFAGDDVSVVGPASVLAMFQEEHDVAPVQTRDIAALRAGNFDRIVLFTNSFGSAWVAKRAGIAERWGYGGGGRGILLTRAVRAPRKPERGHQVDFYRTLARRLVEGDGLDAIDGLDAPPRLSITPATRAAASEALARARVDTSR